MEKFLRYERIGKGKYDQDNSQYGREQRLSFPHFLNPGLRCERQARVFSMRMRRGGVDAD